MQHRSPRARLLVLFLVAVACLALASTSTGDAGATDTRSAAARHPMAESAEAAFFRVFNEQPQTPDAALQDLMIAYYLDPEDAQTNRLLGLNHLWLAAEGDRQNPRVIEHLYLAETFLLRAQARAPEDARMPSWVLPTQTSLAVIEQDEDRVRAAQQAMVEAYETDPNFHSFVVGLQAFDAPKDDPRFRFALEAMRAAAGCTATGDDSCENHPRWPHNIEAFMVFAADFELKAGNRGQAEAILNAVKQVKGYDTWPYRSVVDERLAELDDRAARYANDNANDDPPSLFTGSNEAACQACHRAR